MARKEMIKKDYLIDTAFIMAKQEGMENVTARKLAAKAGCSTQPIFRLYENMEDLWQEIYSKAVSFFAFFYERCSKLQDEPFVNLGLAYIQFIALLMIFCMCLIISDVSALEGKLDLRR